MLAPSSSTPQPIHRNGRQPYTKLVEFPPGPRARVIAWTPDGRALIVGKQDWTSDIVVPDQGR